MHEDIEKLIQIAIRNDVVTNKQREIIRRKALSIGEDPDEAEFLLDEAIKQKQKETNAQTSDVSQYDKDTQDEEDDDDNVTLTPVKVPEFVQTLKQIGSTPLKININTPPTTATNTPNIPCTNSNKNRLVAALLAIFLGYIGLHKFYLGDIKKGILFVLFSWTFVPAIIGFVQGIIFLTQTDEQFNANLNK